MTKLTLGIVNKTLFNVDVRAQAEHIRALMTIILAGTDHRINNYNPISRLFQTNARRELAARRTFCDRWFRLFAEHGVQGEDKGDLYSMLLAAHDDDGNPMSKQQLRDEVIALLYRRPRFDAHTRWPGPFSGGARSRGIAARLLPELAPLQPPPSAIWPSCLTANR